MDRRGFIKLCAGAGALLAAGPGALAADARPRLYARVKLIGEDGRPAHASALEPGRNYIFPYPFAATPCFLLNLGRPTARDATLATEDGAPYRWPGGVGPDRAIVAYSAICAHQLAYPTRQVSFIGYRAHPSGAAAPSDRGVITCCANYSVYDPAEGARVLSGPAKQPLAAVLLEYRETDDALFAVGTFGREMFPAFFERYAFRLDLEYGPGNARRPVTDAAVVVPLEHYSGTWAAC